MEKICKCTLVIQKKISLHRLSKFHFSVLKLSEEVNFHSGVKKEAFFRSFYTFNPFERQDTALEEKQTKTHQLRIIKRINAADKIALLNENVANLETLPFAAAVLELWEFELRRFVFTCNFCSSDCFVSGSM